MDAIVLRIVNPLETRAMYASESAPHPEAAQRTGRRTRSHRERDTSFKAIQIYELVKTLSFDRGKVQLAKELYSKCVDKQNFYQVFEALSFDSSKRELNDYIAGR